MKFLLQYQQLFFQQFNPSLQPHPPFIALQNVLLQEITTPPTCPQRNLTNHPLRELIEILPTCSLSDFLMTLEKILVKQPATHIITKKSNLQMLLIAFLDNYSHAFLWPQEIDLFPEVKRQLITPLLLVYKNRLNNCIEALQNQVQSENPYFIRCWAWEKLGKLSVILGHQNNKLFETLLHNLSDREVGGIALKALIEIKIPRAQQLSILDRILAIFNKKNIIGIEQMAGWATHLMPHLQLLTEDSEAFIAALIPIIDLSVRALKISQYFKREFTGYSSLDRGMEKTLSQRLEDHTIIQWAGFNILASLTISPSQQLPLVNLAASALTPGNPLGLTLLTRIPIPDEMHPQLAPTLINIIEGRSLLGDKETASIVLNKLNRTATQKTHLVQNMLAALATPYLGNRGYYQGQVEHGCRVLKQCEIPQDLCEEVMSVFLNQASFPTEVMETFAQLKMPLIEKDKLSDKLMAIVTEEKGKWESAAILLSWLEVSPLQLERIIERLLQNLNASYLSKNVKETLCRLLATLKIPSKLYAQVVDTFLLLLSSIKNDERAVILKHFFNIFKSMRLPALLVEKIVHLILPIASAERCYYRHEALKCLKHLTVPDTSCTVFISSILRIVDLLTYREEDEELKEACIILANSAIPQEAQAAVIKTLLPLLTNKEVALHAGYALAKLKFSSEVLKALLKALEAKRIDLENVSKILLPLSVPEDHHFEMVDALLTKLSECAGRCQYTYALLGTLDIPIAYRQKMKDVLFSKLPYSDKAYETLIKQGVPCSEIIEHLFTILPTSSESRREAICGFLARIKKDIPVTAYNGVLEHLQNLLVDENDRVKLMAAKSLLKLASVSSMALLNLQIKLISWRESVPPSTSSLTRCLIQVLLYDCYQATAPMHIISSMNTILPSPVVQKILQPQQAGLKR